MVGKKLPVVALAAAVEKLNRSIFGPGRHRAAVTENLEVDRHLIRADVLITFVCLVLFVFFVIRAVHYGIRPVIILIAPMSPSAGRRFVLLVVLGKFESFGCLYRNFDLRGLSAACARCDDGCNPGIQRCYDAVGYGYDRLSFVLDAPFDFRAFLRNAVF